MIESLLIQSADFFFRMTSSSFRMDPDPHAQRMQPALSHSRIFEITAHELKLAGPSCIVAAIREFSFPEMLAILFGVSQDAKHCILNALIEHHELRSALDFALHFEDSKKLQNSIHDSAGIAEKFLDRLRAAMAASQHEAKSNSISSNSNGESGRHKIINLLTASQLVLASGISVTKSNQIVAARRQKIFDSIEDLTLRAGDGLSKGDIEKLAKLF